MSILTSSRLSPIAQTSLITGHERMVEFESTSTGAKGMLGTDLCRELEKQSYQVCATDIQDMDVRRPNRVRQAFSDFTPDLVLHLAALTDVDACEQEPEEAFRTNTVGTQHIALACQKAGIPMVYISTISVFDGTNANHTRNSTSLIHRAGIVVQSTKARKSSSSCCSNTILSGRLDVRRRARGQKIRCQDYRIGTNSDRTEDCE